MATVVAVFRLPRGAMSTAADSAVIAASVTTGGISESVPIAVVLPAPNPPPTTIFTGTGGGRSADVDVAPRGSRKTSTTVAMDFGRLTVDDSLVLYLFGTPGQNRFGFMWPELCSGALGGIVMVDTARIADCFVAIDYFEKIHLPFVVAVNQFDGRENLPLDDVRAATNIEPDIPVVGVDARSHESMRGAAMQLLDLILARARR